MWWIAACLGALLWLLTIRIKLKDAGRLGGPQRSSKVLGLGGRGPLSDVELRQAFVEQGFVPAAERYLKEQPELNSVVLLLARFIDESGGLGAVHCEVIPFVQSQPTWPADAGSSPIVKEDQGVLVARPPQTHWEWLAALEPWRHALPAFAGQLRPALTSEPLVSAYRACAVVSRVAGGFELRRVLSVDAPESTLRAE